MKLVLQLVLILFLYACADVGLAPIEKQKWCDPPRQKVCTMEYRPVCGDLSSGEKQDFSSPCNACANDEVASYSLGPCKEKTN